MKAKLTNGVELIELEGTSEELLKFYTELKKNQTSPWFYWNVPPVTVTAPVNCLHEFDYTRIVPACTKCGQLAYTLPPYIIDPTYPLWPQYPCPPGPFYCTTSLSSLD